MPYRQKQAYDAGHFEGMKAVRAKIQAVYEDGGYDPYNEDPKYGEGYYDAFRKALKTIDDLIKETAP